MTAFRLKTPSVVPGFGISLGFTLLYLLLIVLIPLSGLFFRAAQMPWADFVTAVTSPRVVSAYRVTFGISLLAALVNLVFGTIVAWVLVRYRLPFRKLFDAMVDLPFALPTSVAGIALSALYAPTGWVGKWFTPLGIKIAFTPLGIAIALIFVGLPFVVRTVEPILRDMDREAEEAAARPWGNAPSGLP